MRMSKFRLPVLNWLRAFEAAARHQSIKRACEELHVTHTAVSRQIQNLELQLGRDLFERHHRKIVLNGAERFCSMPSLSALSHPTRDRATECESGTAALVISVDPDFAGLWLVPRLAEFSAIAPETLVEIRSERGFNCLIDSEIGAIQYAEAGIDIENGEVLFRSRLFPVCTPVFAQLSPLRTPADLRGRTLLHDRSISEWQEFFRSCSVTIDIDVGSGIIFSETALCLDAAARGQGIAIGDDFLAAMHLAEGRLVNVFDSGFLSKNAYYFIVPKELRGIPPSTRFAPGFC